MAIYGSLRTMPLADLLQWVTTTSRSGVLTVSRDGNEWELVLGSGAVTGYSGPELRDNLGHIVVTSGLLTEVDLRTAIQHQRLVGGTLQNAMLSKGLINPEALQECLRELAVESIYDLFIDLPGEFVFSEQIPAGLDLGLDEGVDLLPLELDVNHLLMEGARRQDEWSHVRERFPRDDVKVRIIYDHVPPFEKLRVRERRILASLSAGQSVSDICLELRAPILSVLRTLVGFEEIGAVRFEKDEQETAGARAGRLDQLMKQAEVLREAHQFDEAASLLEVVVRMRPDSERARTVLKETLEEQIKDLYAALPPLKVPVLVADEARLSRLKLRPEERFLMNRLAAHMDVGSLIMVSSLNERDTLKTLKKLLHSGIIELQ